MVPCVCSRPHSVHGRTLRVSGRGVNHGPLRPLPSAVNTRHTRALGQGRKASRAAGELEAHPRLNEVKDGATAKSHPAEPDARGAVPEPPEGTRGPDNGRTDAAGGVDPRRSTERVRRTWRAAGGDGRKGAA